MANFSHVKTAHERGAHDVGSTAVCRRLQGASLFLSTVMAREIDDPSPVLDSQAITTGANKAGGRACGESGCGHGPPAGDPVLRPGPSAAAAGRSFSRQERQSLFQRCQSGVARYLALAISDTHTTYTNAARARRPPGRLASSAKKAGGGSGGPPLLLSSFTHPPSHLGPRVPPLSSRTT